MERLVGEARERDGRRFDAVVIYSTSRLARDLFHALAFERELARAGVHVYYAIAAGDQTSPEGRLVRHLFQALDSSRSRSSGERFVEDKRRTPGRATGTAVARHTATGWHARPILTRVVHGAAITRPG